MHRHENNGRAIHEQFQYSSNKSSLKYRNQLSSRRFNLSLSWTKIKKFQKFRSIEINRILNFEVVCVNLTGGTRSELSQAIVTSNCHK